MRNEYLSVVAITKNYISKSTYKEFEKTIKNLYEFLHIFKSDLKDIEINKKEDEDLLICNLIMVYDTYKIDAEYESTGIKKLIKLLTNTLLCAIFIVVHRSFYLRRKEYEKIRTNCL